jgi:copper(I)-binding protein
MRPSFRRLLPRTSALLLACSREAPPTEGNWLVPAKLGETTFFYGTVHNTTDSVMVLTGAEVDVATRAAFQRFVTADGGVRTERVDTVVVPPHGVATLDSAGVHLAAFGLVAPLQPLDTVVVRLRGPSHPAVILEGVVRTR